MLYLILRKKGRKFTMKENLYLIGQVSKKLNIPISTLHYYDKQGLLPLVKRNSNGNRLFDDRDLEILYYITCFKDAGMTIKQIKTYFELYEQGANKKEDRKVLLEQQLVTLEEKISELEKAKKVLIGKINEL